MTAKFISILICIFFFKLTNTSDWRVRYYHQLREDSQKEHQILCGAYCNYSNVDLCDVNEITRSLADSDTDKIELPVLSEELARFNKMNWRYLPMLDQHVDRMLARDTDSEINSREAAAVYEWLESNYTFHVMRDHPAHNKPIMGGRPFSSKTCYRLIGRLITELDE